MKNLTSKFEQDVLETVDIILKNKNSNIERYEHEGYYSYGKCNNLEFTLQFIDNEYSNKEVFRGCSNIEFNLEINEKYNYSRSSDDSKLSKYIIYVGIILNQSKINFIL